ncbi:amidohydrolase family protein [Exophiala viscosa]|uniref:amidohydrolase family protein n=1 Tax=Exophiala viscosa TaxID=2486360 RepID=UPI00218E7781|nr:amidohydrolase family protein [Exophiala viscosa]
MIYHQPKVGPTIVRNARIFTCSPQSEDLISGSIIFENGLIKYVGEEDSDELIQARAAGAVGIDAEGRVVTPSFIDSHVHILHFGLSLGKLDVMKCKSLEDIRAQIKAWASAHPDKARILCKGWQQSCVASEALASMLDDLDPRPIYIEAIDLHSVWCNKAALDELGVASMADPDGGTIHRDEMGQPSGLLSESAFLLIASQYLFNALSVDEKQAGLHRALTTFSKAGYTGVIDMAMDEEQWSALQLYRQKQQVPLHIGAYWLVPYSTSDEEIQTHLNKAIEMHRKFHPSTSPSFCVLGIKLIADGVVDGCTAALSKPYGAKADPVEPIWPAETLARVVAQADAAGLQCAVHAIGDRAVTQAIDAFARLERSSRRRHRIEHLELTTAKDAQRLGELGIIASVQPVHSDPAILRGWPGLIGSHRCKRAFAYREFFEAGAPMAFGTDVPTAAHHPLLNLYNATTRRSAIEPDCLDTTNEHFAVSLSNAIKAATIGAAYTRYAEMWTGSIAPGMSADFNVVDMEWDPASLLHAKVRQTWYKGQRVFDNEV